MKGQLSQETVVEVPTEEFWQVYRGYERIRLLHELLGDGLGVGKPEIIEGDGGVGTIVKIAKAQGVPWNCPYTKELYTKIDDENRVSEIELIEGGFKDLGFDPCRVRLEIIEKDGGTRTIVKSTVEFEIDDKLGHNLAFLHIDALGTVAQTIADYLQRRNAST